VTPTLTRGWYLGLTTGASDNIYFQAYNSTGQSAPAGGPFFQAGLNRWMHVAGVYKAGEYTRLYLNGTLHDENTTNVINQIAYSSTTDLRIGQRADTTTANWNGYIDELQVYSRALTAAEINATYQAGTYRYHNNFTGLREGKYWAKIFAADAAGLKESGSREARIDNTTPRINYAEGTETDKTTSSENEITVNVTIIDTNERSAFIDWNRTLAGWWNFEYVNSSGTVFGNSSYGNDCITVSKPTNETVFGVRGRAMDFEIGGDERVNCLSAQNLDDIFTTGGTVSAWIKPYGLGQSDQGVIIAKQDLSSAGSWALRLGASNRIVFFKEHTGTDLISQSATDSVEDGIWQHVAVTWTGGMDASESVKFYIDGELISHAADQDGTVGPRSDAALSVYIGNNEGGTADFNGSIDEPMLIRRVLTQGEIRALYDNRVYHLNRTFEGLNDGNYSFRGYTIDVAGHINRTGEYMIELDQIAPLIVFDTPPTPPNATTLSVNSAQVNVTTTDANDHSAFIDWNRSLVGWWNFEYYNSTHVFDNSTYGNFGSFVSMSSDDFIEGPRGNAVHLNGVNQYLNIKDSNSLDVSSELTLEAWVNPSSFDNTGGYEGIIWKNNLQDVNFNTVYMLSTYWNSGHPTFIVSTSTRSFVTDSGDCIPTTELILNQWQHIAVTYDGIHNITTFYRNGLLDGGCTTINGTINSSNEDVRIGRWSGGYFNGSIDEPRIWSRVLSSAEINASYNAGLYKLSRNFTDLSEGVYTYKAYAIDSAGNIATTENRELNVDYYSISECTNISSPGQYTLSHNLSSPGTCIRINASNVRLDLMGYTITYAESAVGHGIIIDTRKNITIRNGTVTLGNFINNTIAIRILSSDNISLQEVIAIKDRHTDKLYGPLSYFLNVTNLLINASSFYSNNTVGVYIYSSRNVSILKTNSTTGECFHESKCPAISFVYSSDIIINRTTAYGNNGSGLRFYGTNSTRVQNCNSSSINFNAVSIVTGSYDNEYHNSRFQSGKYAISVGQSENNTFRDIVANSTNGVYLSYSNQTTLDNVNSTTGACSTTYGCAAISLAYSNNNIINNSFATSINGTGIRLYDSSHCSIENSFARSVSGPGITLTDSSKFNTIKNCSAISSNRYGLDFLLHSDNNTLSLMTIISNTSSAINLNVNNINISESMISNNDCVNWWECEAVNIVGNNSRIENSTISSNSSVAVRFYKGKHNTLVSTNLSGGTGKAEVYVDNDANGTLLNCTFTQKGVYDTSHLTVQWFLDVYVNDTLGGLVSGATVIGRQEDNSMMFSEYSGITGYISRQEVTEYIQDSSSIDYFTNYTISASMNGLGADSKSLNFTNSSNLKGKFYLTITNETPMIAFVTPPTPINGSILSRSWAQINVSTSDDTDHSAFIDWNRSLVGWWNFEYHNSTHVFDNSTYQNNGWIENIVSFTPGGPRGMYALFNGNNDDNLQIGTDESLHFGVGTDLSVLSWIKQGNITEYWSPVDKGADLNDRPGFRFELSPISKRIWFGLGNGSERKLATSSTKMNDSSWHFVAGVLDHSGKIGPAHTLYIFVDGIEEGSIAVPVGFNFSNQSRELTLGNSYFNGSIDEVMIWNRALSRAEINASYNAGIHRLERNFTDLSDGVYTYKAYAIDAAGNINSTERRELTIDYTAPNIEFKPPTADNWTFSTSNFTYVNVSVNDTNPVSAFIDWNRSLQLWLTFDNFSGSNPLDLSSYNHTSQAHGDAEQISGRYGQAMNFSNYWSYVNVSSFDSTSTITIEAWVNLHAYSDWQRIVSKYFFSGYGDGSGSWIMFLSDERTIICSFNISESFQATESPEVIELEDWTHVACIYNGTEIITSIDRVATSSAASGPLGTSTYPITIGASSNGTHLQNQLFASVDEVRIHNRALSPAEINASYNAGIHRLERNFTELSEGAYTYKAYAIDAAGNINSTEEREYTYVVSICDEFCHTCDECTEKIGSAQTGEMVCMTSDIASASGCIDINADDITFNCQGNTLTGMQAGMGINMSNKEEVTIENCVVTNFTRAINVNGTNNSVFRNNTIIGNKMGTYSGMILSRSNRNNISNTLFLKNNASKNAGLFLTTSTYTRAINNTFLDSNVTRNGYINGGGIVGLYNFTNLSYFENTKASNNKIRMTHTSNGNEINGGGIVGAHNGCSYNRFNITNLTGNSIISYEDIYGGGVMGFSISNYNRMVSVYASDNTISAQDLIRGGIIGLKNSGYNNISSVIVAHNNFSGIGAISGAGGVGIAYYSHFNRINNINVTGNTINIFTILGGGGAGIDYRSSFNTINSVSVTNNNITADNSDIGGGIGGGGGVGIGDYIANYNKISSVTVTNNKIVGNIFGGGGIGFYYHSIRNHIINANIAHNNISAKYIWGGGMMGIHYYYNTSNMTGITLINNTVTAEYIFGGGGIGIVEGPDSNLIKDVTYINNTINSNYEFGVLGLNGNATRNKITNITIIGSTENIIYLSNSSKNGQQNNNFTNITLLNAGKHAIKIIHPETYNNTFRNIYINGSISSAINITNARKTNFENIIINNTAWHYYFQNATVGQYDFANASIDARNQFGIIRFTNKTITASGANLSKIINITLRNAQVRTDLDPGFNTSANITINFLPSSRPPRAQVDYEDDGTFIMCNEPQCYNLSYAGETFLFNVSHFTSYRGQNNTPPGPPNLVWPIIENTTHHSDSGDAADDHWLSNGKRTTVWGTGENFSVTWNASHVNYSFTGLNASRLYKLAVIYYRGDSANVVQTLTAEGIPLHGAVSVNASGTSRIIELPAVAYNDGKLNLNFSKISGSNVTVASLRLIEYDTILDVMPTFIWENATDAEGDALTYHIQVCEEETCTVKAINDNNVSSPYINLTDQLEPGNMYWWRVRANDTLDGGNWSRIGNFTLDYTISIVLLNDTVDFGTAVPGDILDSTGNDPTPFVIENDGNCFVNLSVTTNSLWLNQPLGTHYFQGKIRGSNETYSFDIAASNTSWFNLTASYMDFAARLNHTDSNDSCYFDLKVEVPLMEPPGQKASDMTFRAEQTT